MNLIQDVISRLTSNVDRLNSSSAYLNDFAQELGWAPSEKFLPRISDDYVNSHLIVEHGLQNSAVITFIKSPNKFSEIQYSHKKKLLSVSYNNLVDWHIGIDKDSAYFVYNRSEPFPIIKKIEFGRDSVDSLRGEFFERIEADRPNPNLPALDDAFIRTISFWKRNISAELNNEVSNESLSSLFNAIICVRSIEDNYSKSPASFESIKQPHSSSKLLLSGIQHKIDKNVPLSEYFNLLLKSLNVTGLSENFISDSRLKVFDRIDGKLWFSFFNDFYQNKFAPYEYDFSIISKQALSRIYERYVSVLKIEDSNQLALFPQIPDEELNKQYGSIYTPQYIARFFSRFIRDELPPSKYRNIKVVDPAVGSGIFLRTILELQCDPFNESITSSSIENCFSNVVGVDIDKNACNAAQLSLSLLHYTLSGKLHPSLKIINAESLGYLSDKKFESSFDCVIANPPYVSLQLQSDEMKQRIETIVGKEALGRIDAYVAFLSLSIKLLKPGGLGLFVLPHSFLISKSGRSTRKLISETCWLKFVADLSSIRVFENVGTYVILLIIQKKSDLPAIPPHATILKCQDFVGKALNDVILGRKLTTDYYSIYEVEQELFSRDSWKVMPPVESRLEAKLEGLKRLKDFLTVRQGFNSGADHIFIVSKSKIPKGEEVLFVPVLTDREMISYAVPKSSDLYFFYPYYQNEKISESFLKSKFKLTWKYLNSYKVELEKRSSVLKSTLAWWEPDRPRQPEHMLRPKIVSPHLVFVPKFSLDIAGKYAVSRAPFLYPKEEGSEKELLMFFLGILNSSVCYWYISNHSHVYRNGYVMLEPASLQNIPVPSPKDVPSSDMKKFLNLVEMRIRASKQDSALQSDIDAAAANMYGLSKSELEAINIL